MVPTDYEGIEILKYRQHLENDNIASAHIA